ncbi:alpha/beta hydrolase [Streptomyces sp. CA-210063]|uniref:alpha/beta fold hydrolase n=1 Tax=Streptomyces sp. CA-210063 TaxID=2801029 RepID=UPI00214D019B|nr:alpha/beta hydrolase [Streptomyces sp. CA-210063]UUU34208.1 alpha/beta hydrolase [Streptomyces sp. CA-210063]
MATFHAPDGTPLSYRVLGDGPPLVCLPGGPMRASAYLGDLGGLSAHRRLVMLDLRGTGGSAVPEDTATYRCDRQADDIEALREHLGLEQVDLLAHCAGANLAAAYVARHPDRVGRLVLVTPSPLGVGIAVGGEDRLALARLRKGEPWFGEAFAALEAIAAGRAEEGHWEAVAPFFHGRWDGAAQALHAADEEQRNGEAAGVFGSAGAFDPEGTRAALGRFGAPVLVLAGEVDLNSPPRAMAEYAGLFPGARLAVQDGASHHPWMDDARGFTATVAGFLT